LGRSWFDAVLDGCAGQVVAAEDEVAARKGGSSAWRFADAIDGYPATHVEDPVIGSGLQGLADGGPTSGHVVAPGGLRLGSGQLIDELPRDGLREVHGRWVGATTWCGGDRGDRLSTGGPCRD
jgi:hypothetical protein